MRRTLATLVVCSLMTLVVATPRAVAGPNEDAASVVTVARAAVVSEIGAPGSPAPALDHLRPTDAAVTRLLTRGVAASATFRDLAVRLQRSDVILYIDRQPAMLPKHVGAGITFLADGGEYRYLRVSLNTGSGDATLVALLGHELQHALELSAAPEVRSSRALTAFYARTGLVDESEHTFDTREAQVIGVRVRDELAGGAVATLVARVEDPIDPVPAPGAPAQPATPKP